MILIDTNILLDGIYPNEKFYLSSITLEELENIKTSSTKDADVKYQARQALKWLEKHEELYDIILWTEKYQKTLKKLSLSDTMDNKIIVCAYEKAKTEKGLIFCSNDLSARTLAKHIAGLKVSSIAVSAHEEYNGYKEIIFKNDDELAKFYQNAFEDKEVSSFNLLENQYLILKDSEDNIIDEYKWIKGEGLQKVSYNTTDSIYFGKIKPQDTYQKLALDSFKTNQITALRGPAGSGKSLLALSYLFELREKGKIDKIIIFTNTVATKGSAKLGYYPGDRDEKQLDSSIGGFLASKIGDMAEVEAEIADGRLVLIPLADSRGYDTSGMRAGIYMTEAQNSTRDTMKLTLSRIGEDCIAIIEGDTESQVDMADYAGSSNGLRRMIEVFKGDSVFGTVTLKNIYRSHIAELSDKL